MFNALRQFTVYVHINIISKLFKHVKKSKVLFQIVQQQ